MILAEIKLGQLVWFTLLSIKRFLGSLLRNYPPNIFFFYGIVLKN